MSTTYHVIGDAYVDLFCFLDGDWPERGGDALLNQPVKSYAGGSSTNTATHLKSLLRQLHSDSEEFERVILHTVLNPDDQFGQLLQEHASKYGFPLVNCRKAGDDSSTGHCIVVVSRGERTFMTHQGCMHKFSARHIDLSTMIDKDGPIHVHVAGFFNTPLFWHGQLEEQLRTLRQRRREKFPQHTTTISLVTQHDASNEWDGGIDSLLQHLDILIMNEVEANRVMLRGRGGNTGDSSGNGELTEWASFFCSKNSSACIVVTQGSKGAVAFRNHEVIGNLTPAVEVEVVDPTGAGDSFAAGLLYGMLKSSLEIDTDKKQPKLPNTSIRDGLEWGCALGTACVKVRGASIPSNIESIVEVFEQQKQDGA